MTMKSQHSIYKMEEGFILENMISCLDKRERYSIILGGILHDH